MTDIKLDFIIPGIQKSASSFLQSSIRAHPQVFMPLHETPTFLPDHYEENLESLRRVLAPAPDYSTIGIKRPDYLVEEGCAERIHKHFPDCKFIIVLRNPVDRAYSAYMHLMTLGYIPVLNPDEGFCKLLDGTLQEAYPKSETILSYGRYGNGVRTYLRLFGRYKILFLLHDDIVTNAKDVLRGVYAFLDVDPGYAPINELRRRPRSSINSLIRQRVNQFASRQRHDFSSDGRSYSIKPNPAVFRMLSSRIAYTIDRRILKYICSNQKLPLSPLTIKSLYDYYEGQISEMEGLLQRDLSKWKELKDNI